MEETTLFQYIREIEYLKDDVDNHDEYPFNLPSVEFITNLKLHPKVTFIVGENGSGKSTLLEAIAIACGFNPEGGTKNFNFSTLPTHSDLHDYIRIVRGAKRPRDGFFLRAESFYNVATEVEILNEDDGGLISSYGGKSLHNQSHGESFMTLMLRRFGGQSLYILDEPEAALSPTRQMALLTRIHELVEDNCQFIIATHSPILMAYPQATIYSVDNAYKEVKYTETEHYQITKEFLNHPDKMLSLLLEK